MSSSTPIPYKKITEKPDPHLIVAEPIAEPAQGELFQLGFPARVAAFPQIRFMGSKYRLLPWIHTVLSGLSFDSAADAFSGSGCVGYLFKAMGKQVVSNDFLNLGTTLAKALIENPGRQLSSSSLEMLLHADRDRQPPSTTDGRTPPIAATFSTGSCRNRWASSTWIRPTFLAPTTTAI